jgi:hypothetical protein
VRGFVDVCDAAPSAETPDTFFHMDCQDTF